MAKSSLIDLTAVEARNKMAKGEISAVEYTKAYIARIEEREPVVQAWAWFDAGHALKQAEALDKRRKAGESLGSLHGLPVGIKDIIDTADMPTQNGSPIYKGYQPAKDAACISALRAAGAIIMGKTVTTELATLTPNKTRNPHNPEHTPGGSSSGSAAGVGDRMIPLALGTQTGGSVIRPGSFNGVHALKPTLGRISRTGVTMQSNTLDTIGVYARSLADIALITDALSGHDPSDAVSYDRVRPETSAVLAAGTAIQPTFGFFKSPAWDQAEAGAKEGLAMVLKALGAAVDEIDIPAMAPVLKHHAAVMGSENAHFYGPLLARNPEGVSPGLTERLKIGAKVLGSDYVAALEARETMYAAVEAALDKHAALITLPSCGPAPKGLGATGNAIFNGMWTLLGVPCVTLPLMTIGGMPCGVQLIGKRRDEGRLLAVARWVEENVKPIKI